MQPSLQVDIVNVTERLGQSAMQRATVANIGATSDLMKHLRKCLQNSSKFSNPGVAVMDGMLIFSLPWKNASHSSQIRSAVVP
ncbi:hypothetical protein D5086_030108 [Populus alba]|uniref:Uncharacterized protein n=1 Tax=Populus alba TaxID=43335 RepID=A0ACC4ANJ6_POPAL